MCKLQSLSSVFRGTAHKSWTLWSTQHSTAQHSTAHQQCQWESTGTGPDRIAFSLMSRQHSTDRARNNSPRLSSVCHTAKAAESCVVCELMRIESNPRVFRNPYTKWLCFSSPFLARVSPFFDVLTPADDLVFVATGNNITFSAQIWCNWSRRWGGVSTGMRERQSVSTYDSAIVFIVLFMISFEIVVEGRRNLFQIN